MAAARIIFAAALLLPMAGRSPAAVRVWQDSITLPTTVEDLPQAAPQWDTLSPGKGIYPYTYRGNLKPQRVPETWRRINLENEYLACTFLPDLGGRLYSCTDKLNGHSLFYANPSIKKDTIGFRGSWAAAGVELNFAVAHHYNSVSPANFGFRQGEDEARVWIGMVDRTSDMEMMCEFVLRSGSAVLEQNVTLTNPTAVRHRYQWWSNAAIEVEDGTRFVVPTHMRNLHGTDLLDTWPVNSKGVDESVFANGREQAGYFAIGSHEAYMAIYHGGSRTATVHVADPAAVPGKKIWTWGTRTEAQIRKELSDNNSLYAEMQAGLMQTQDEFQFLQPHQTVRFTEYWMGGRDLGGVSRATVDAILNLEKTSAGGKPALQVELNVTHSIPHATLRILDGAAVVWEETADLTPASKISRSIPVRAAEGSYRLELVDGKGKVLLSHAPGECHADVGRPGKMPLPTDPRSTAEGDYLARGTEYELRNEFRSAEEEYGRGLLRHPSSLQLKKAAGRLLAERRRFDEALQLLSEVSAGMPDDMETRYYLGVARSGILQEDAARQEWGAARRDPAFGAPALVETAASLARSGSPEEALDLLRQALEIRPDMLRAGRMQVALLRAAGKTDEEQERLQYWRSRAPIDPFLRLEQLLRNGAADTGLWEYLAADPERVLDIADEYLNLGLFRDSLTVLERNYPAAPATQMEPGKKPPQQDAMVLYYRAFVHSLLGDDPSTDFQAAAAASVDFVFPHRISSRRVLEAALRQTPEDASAHWLLGEMYADSNLLDDAIAEWSKVTHRDRTPMLTPMLTKALALKQLLSAEKSRRSIEAARESAARSGPGARPAVNRPEFPTENLEEITGTPEEIAFRALIVTASGSAGQALGLFNVKHFPQDRQPRAVRDAYFEVRLQNFRSIAAGGRCGEALTGLDNIESYNGDLPFTFHGFADLSKTLRFDYRVAEMKAYCRDRGAARRLWSKLAKAKADPESPDFAFPALSALKLGNSGAQKAVAAALDEVTKALEKAPEERRGVLLYSQGLLLRAAGDHDKAIAAFQAGANAPNFGMSKYLNLMALSDAE